MRRNFGVVKRSLQVGLSFRIDSLVGGTNVSEGRIADTVVLVYLIIGGIVFRQIKGNHLVLARVEDRNSDSANLVIVFKN